MWSRYGKWKSGAGMFIFVQKYEKYLLLGQPVSFAEVMTFEVMHYSILGLFLHKMVFMGI
jgi:hypothetical protein